MKTLLEYMNSKGKVEAGKVDIHGDRTDPMTPPNAPKGGGKPYAASNGKAKKSKNGKGFGDQGDKDLVYKPDIEGGTDKKGAKIPTCEFAQYELVPLISESLEKNPFIAESIVRDLKRRGVLGILIGELMEHRETYKHLAAIMGHKTQGQQICSKLVRAMKEEISPPFGAGHDDEDEFGGGEEDDLEDSGLDDVSVDDETMDFDMDDAEMGGEDDMMGPDGEPCPMCDGQEGNEECEICHGTGFVDDLDQPEDEEGMGDLDGAAMGGGEMPAPGPSMAMQNFQRAMMSRM